MPRVRPLHPNQLLVTFDQAAAMLACDRNRVLALIAQGHLQPHPYEADKIARIVVESYALNYAHATPNEPHTRDLRQVNEPVEETPSDYGFVRA